MYSTGFFYENRLATDFKEKYDLLHSFVCKECLVKKTIVKFHLFYMSELIRFYQISHLIEKDMETFISNLDLNKAHRDDMISTRMLKIYSKSIIKPLKILSKQSLEKGCFTVEWKKVNIVSAYKKMNHRLGKTFA